MILRYVGITMLLLIMLGATCILLVAIIKLGGERVDRMKIGDMTIGEKKAYRQGREDILEGRCRWTLHGDADFNVWKTDCNKLNQFEEGTPYQNEFKFCPYCGRRIVTRRIDKEG